MYNAQWSPGTDLSVIKAPPITRITIMLSANIQDPTQVGELARLGENLVDYYAGSIHHFIAAQRMLARSLEQYGAEQKFADLVDVVYKSNQGTELIDIAVFPQNFLTPVLTSEQTPETEEILIGLILDIKQDFVNWPLPGYQFVLGGGTGFWTGPLYGNYYYDSMFVPLPVPSGAGDDTDDFDLGLLPALAGAVALTWQPTGDGPSGDGWYNKSVGGSGICITPLSGQQYWEVTIVALPPSGVVPPSISTTITISGESDAFSYTDPTYTTNNPGSATSSTESISWLWPTTLDTFLSPVIGLVPQCYLDPSWKKNTVDFGGVIGLDYDPSQPRSIGAVRTSLIQGDWSSSDTPAATGFLTVTGTQDMTYTNMSGASAGGEVGGTSYGCISTTSPPTGTKTWNPDDVIGIGTEYLCMCIGTSNDSSVTPDTGPGTGPSAGPSVAACAAYVADISPTLVGSHSVPPIAVGSVYFVVIGTVSYGLFPQFFLAYVPGNSSSNIFHTSPGDAIGPITYSSGASPPVVGSGSKPFGDAFLAADAYEMDGVTLALTGVNTLGRHMPVFKGRADGLVSTQTPHQDATPNLTATPATVGVWTGVDLGDLAEKDVIMIATDTHSRNVWFGKNGKWYDTTGPTEHQPGDDGFDPATVMDGDDTDPTKQYYPAASWRVGPIHMRMGLSAQTQTYFAPGNFQPYATEPPIIVPLS